MKRASKKKYHYIYKTTCNVTGRYYIGMHTTDDLSDGYVGSGKILKNSINKHGKENHVCEILEFYFTREWLCEREAELVCAETLTDPLCMNLKTGGEGGWDHITSQVEVHKQHSSNGGKKGGKATWESVKNDPVKLAEHKAVSSKRMQKLRDEGKVKYDTFSGRSHSQETIDRMKASKVGHGSGCSNSQHGTCWLHSVELQRCKKVKKEDVEAHLQLGWVIGRKMKF